ncbi:hypothetical protein PSPO_b0643 [Pseudoalteromonas spongiae UST010723-006]|nr:hypothetical protein PSPO_b0643 [Pseudoalteromonas spongiae UST010723-006]
MSGSVSSDVYVYLMTRLTDNASKISKTMIELSKKANTTYV